MDILQINNVTKTFGDHLALDNISLTVPKACIFGLLGPNGAGKTTLIRIINLILGSDSGSVLFNGQTLVRKHVELIGYMPEERGLYKKMKVGEQLMYLAQLKGLKSSVAAERINYWLDKFDATTWWDKKVETLSKGMAQKIQFISTVMHQPELIILDEPFSGFDPVNAEIIKDEIIRLKKNGATIIFSTHRMESVEMLCDELALIHHAKVILEGNVNSIREQFRQNLFEVEFESIADGFNINDFPYELIPANFNDKNGFDTHKFRFKTGDKITDVNNVILNLIKIGKIRSFMEVFPHINDIFIQLVKTKPDEQNLIDHKA